jgi:Zn-dependent M28 family amino/carboxypeptidase
MIRFRVQTAMLLCLGLTLAGCNQRSTPPFDEARAFKDVEAQLAFGPRVPGTPAHDRCQAWIAAELAKTGATPALQAFPDTVYGQVYRFTNVRARYGPKSGSWIVVGAHWDTRVIADNDPDPAKRALPIPGANDGASGVAVLLEMARVFQQQAPPIGVELVFFDGEDLGRGGDVGGFCRGSRYYVRALEHPRPALAIVLDMVGDKDLNLYYEVNSRQSARNLVERLWAGAAQVNAPGFIPEERHNVYDDHAPFLEAGIPGIDVIDFDFKAWHTSGDDLSQVSAGSLGQVGRTVLLYVYSSEP